MVDKRDKNKDLLTLKTKNSLLNILGQIVT